MADGIGESAGGIGPLKPTTPGMPGGSGGGAASGFNAAMGSGTNPGGKTTEQNISPMQMAETNQSGMQAGKVSSSEFISNINNAITQMNALQKALQTPGLTLNNRTRRLLKAKLDRTQDNIDYLSSKLDQGDTDPDKGGNKRAQVPEIDGKEDHKSVIKKFVGYLTDGQSQLQGAMEGAKDLKSKDPAIMMSSIFSMQVKLYRAQVEIEFSTAVIQKAIDDIKTLMSVQL